MSAWHRISHFTFSIFPSRYPTFLCHRSSFFCSSLSTITEFSVRPMPKRQVKEFRKWEETPKSKGLPFQEKGEWPTDECITEKFSGLNMTETISSPSPQLPSSSSDVVSPIQWTSLKISDQDPQKGSRGQIWNPRDYGTIAESTAVPTKACNACNVNEEIEIGCQGSSQNDPSDGSLSELFNSSSGATFTVDNYTYARAKIRATFYPKFENEKSDQEVRTKMMEMVSNGRATLEVSLKHSGSLFMYAGNSGGAYAKNSYGNIYTAVGVFVLGRMFQEAWGGEASKKQSEFNDFLERNRICISMELVTAVLGDHGQRPLEDYVVVTAVTELGNGKPRFYSTAEVIAFCRKWRLPTNHIWLFSTRKSVTSFFAAYDALCEEGTATPVCNALDEIADISVPGSKDHTRVQGEILEGLVARIVSRDSSKQMEECLRNHPFPPLEGVGQDMGPSLREVCGSFRTNEKEQIKALLKASGRSMCPSYSDWLGGMPNGSQSKTVDRSIVSKFLQAHPADFSTSKLQEMIRLMRQKRFPAAFKCYFNFHEIPSNSDDIHYKMVIHVHSDSGFRRYQREMRNNPGLWPLYRGFFLDINLFKVNKERALEIAKECSTLLSSDTDKYGVGTSGGDGLADEDANLMIKLKFLTYKLRTFLIRNGLPILFKEGPTAYKAYYLRQMKTWGTSPGKQRDLSKMLDEWAIFIRRKYGHKQVSSSTYLTEAEPFLEQYAKCSPQNQALIGSAGNLVKTENFLAIVGGIDEEGDIVHESETPPEVPKLMDDTVHKDEGLIVFFPGIPGCAKSALCKEILSVPGGLGDDRPMYSLMGDLIKGRYWPRVADELKKKPFSITLADKNAPNEEVWRQIEDMCRSTKSSAVPVVPDSEGTDSNPFSLDALAVFMFRVLQRVNHPGNLDKASKNAGYVLLMFYNLYEGKSRKEFENELSERFGAIIKMPLLKTDRNPLPKPVREVIEEGLSLYKLHTNRHGRLDSTKGSYAKEWTHWEKRLREVLNADGEYLNSIQVPFDFAVKVVLEELRSVAKGERKTPSSEKRRFGNIIYAAVTLPVSEIKSILQKVSERNTEINSFLKEKDLETTLQRAHVTLAHKRSHGVTAVASYGVFLNHEVPVDITALVFSDKTAALEACPGSVEGERIQSKNEWPHVTIWTAAGTSAKEANTLPQLVSEKKATRVEIEPPVTVSGILVFY